MPISKKVEGVLDDFFNSGNEYDDNYGDDFDSADGDSEKDASTSTYKKETTSKISSPRNGREDTQTTTGSTHRSKRGPEKSFASSSGGYTNNDRITYSEPSRRHQSGTSYVRSDKGRTGAWYNKKKGKYSEFFKKGQAGKFILRVEDLRGALQNLGAQM